MGLLGLSMLIEMVIHNLNKLKLRRFWDLQTLSIHQHALVDQPSAVAFMATCLFENLNQRARIASKSPNWSEAHMLAGTERERERERERESGRQREREIECVCVCVSLGDEGMGMRSATWVVRATFARVQIPLALEVPLEVPRVPCEKRCAL